MKKASTIFSVLIALSFTGISPKATAQQKRHHHDYSRKERQIDRDDDHDDKGRYTHRDKHHRDDDHYHRPHRPVRHVHHHHDHHRPVIVHHYHRKPRYIYYRDYDVYYDCHRNAYLTYSTSGWTVSASLPLVMRHVDIRTARSYEVNYYNDDFPEYLKRERPAYGREYRGW